MKFSKIMISYTIFALLISLVVGVYGQMVADYGITRQDTHDGEDVGTKLDNLVLMKSMNGMVAGVNQLGNPGGFLDIIGGLLSVGIGFLGTLVSITTTPIEILAIIMGFYNFIPPVVPVFIGTIMSIYVAFIIIKAYTGQEF